MTPVPTHKGPRDSGNPTGQAPPSSACPGGGGGSSPRACLATAAAPVRFLPAPPSALRSVPGSSPHPAGRVPGGLGGGSCFFVGLGGTWRGAGTRADPSRILGSPGGSAGAQGGALPGRGPSPGPPRPFPVPSTLAEGRTSVPQDRRPLVLLGSHPRPRTPAPQRRLALPPPPAWRVPPAGARGGTGGAADAQRPPLKEPRGPPRAAGKVGAPGRGADRGRGRRAGT